MNPIRCSEWRRAVAVAIGAPPGTGRHFGEWSERMDDWAALSGLGILADG
jgi:hypothetical protein